MSENIKFDNSEWFRDLSEEKQETLAAGQIINMPGAGNFLLQQNNTITTANNTLQLANGDVSSQQTKYISSQFTLASSITFGIANFSLLGNLINNPILDILNKIFTKN
ncbi:hypothetical protein [Nostoc sp. CCY 9925]|uniref:hypothetical protein n=1 Tax=Nostoc sp. CCY 9925 TaxID=3103865 RepID=UPI0039C5B946